MKLRMESNKGGFDESVRHSLSFVLRLALVLGGLGFASVFAIAGARMGKKLRVESEELRVGIWEKVESGREGEQWWLRES